MTISTAMHAAPAHELAQLEYLLLGDLRQILSEPATSETRRYLVTILELLFELLPERFAMEEDGGYLPEVTKKFPNWHDQVDALRIEHAFLYEDLRDLRRDVDDADRFRTSADRIMTKIGEWMERFGHHEREERRLAQLAMNLELGVGA